MHLGIHLIRFQFHKFKEIYSEVNVFAALISHTDCLLINITILLGFFLKKVSSGLQVTIKVLNKI